MLTNEAKGKRRMGSPYYIKHLGVIEDVIHALWDCPRVKKVWLSLINRKARHLFFNLEMQ